MSAPPPPAPQAGRMAVLRHRRADFHLGCVPSRDQTVPTRIGVTWELDRKAASSPGAEPASRQCGVCTTEPSGPLGPESAVLTRTRTGLDASPPGTVLPLMLCCSEPLTLNRLLSSKWVLMVCFLKKRPSSQPPQFHLDTHPLLPLGSTLHDDGSHPERLDPYSRRRERSGAGVSRHSWGCFWHLAGEPRDATRHPAAREGRPGSAVLRQRPSSRAAPQFPLTRRTGSLSFRTEGTPPRLGLLPPSTSTLLPPGHPQIATAPQRQPPALQGGFREERALGGCALLVSSPSNPKSDLWVLEPPREKRNPAGH